MKKQITIKFWAGTPEYKNALNNTRKELAAQGYKEVTTDRTPANSDTVTIYGNRWGGEWSGRIRFFWKDGTSRHRHKARQTTREEKRPQERRRKDGKRLQVKKAFHIWQ